MKRLWLVLGVSLLLAACAAGGRKTAPADVYDFGMPAERLPTGPQLPGIALEVLAPAWFDSLAIEYRLLYEDPLKLRHYTASRWAGAPAQLLAQRLRQQLGLTDSRAPSATRCLLRFELLEFSQVFDTPQESRGVVRGDATLLDARHRVVERRPVSLDRRARTADAPGGVAALADAADALGQTLSSWLSDEEKRGTLKDCQPRLTEPR